MHSRYNSNTQQFEIINGDRRQHYQPLLEKVFRPTLVIDINLLPVESLDCYCRQVLEHATKEKIYFDQIIYEATQDPIENYEQTTKILDSFTQKIGITSYLAHVRFEVGSHQHLLEFIYPNQIILHKRRPAMPFSTHERKYKFSCLNRNPTMHKLVMYTLIKEQDLLQDFIYTFYDRCPYNGFKYTYQQYKDLLKYIRPSLYDKCLRNLPDFPLTWQNEILGGNNDHTILHDAFIDCYCHVVTETTALLPYASEKLWKPIISGQMFFVAGPPRILEWMKSLGFETFYDDYDKEIDMEYRMSMIVARLKEQQDDARSFWLKHKDQIEHNYNWFYSDNIEKILLQPITDNLNHK